MKKVIPQNSQAHSSLESGKTNDEGMVCEEETCSFVSLVTDMEFVKNFTPSDFQEKKNLHRQFHLILTVLVRKNTKNE